MIINAESRARLQRVLEEHLAAGGEGESRNFLLIMLSLIYDLKEMESRPQKARTPSAACPAGQIRLLPEENLHPRTGNLPRSPAGEAHLIMEENRRLKALLDTLLSRVRFSAPQASETAH